MGGGDLQGSVQALPGHNRVPASFAEVQHDPYPKAVEMAHRSLVVIPCRPVGQKVFDMMSFERAVTTGNTPGPMMTASLSHRKEIAN